MIEQRSPEWFQQRKGKLTGSNIGTALGVNPYKKPADLMRQMVREWHNADSEFKGNVATEWGTANEANATIELEMFHLAAPIEETGLHVHPVHEWLAASPDGLIGDDGVAEIKCPFGLRAKEAPEFKTLFDQPHYFAQTQIEMACTGRTWCAFYQWAPKGDNYHEQAFSQAWFDEALPKLKAFYDAYLVEREMPNAQRYLEPRHTELNNEFIVDLVEQYKEAKERAKELEQQAKDLLSEIIDRCGESESEINGSKLSKVTKKGAVDYGKVPELEDVDLDQYRKVGSSYWALK
jgi:putative phage-type endonuclease